MTLASCAVEAMPISLLVVAPIAPATQLLRTHQQSANKRNAVAVTAQDMEGNVIGTWPTAKAASKATGVDWSDICKMKKGMLSGTRKGLIFL
jgi:ketol-acid reductoisomerase